MEEAAPSPPDFKTLFEKEHELLSQADEYKASLGPVDAEIPGPAGEPWIRSTPISRVGLAFSGGGIRSATFNLGVLKALHELGLLKHVDYLSTVSGGGYVGAWWSAWRARWGKEFPETQTTLLGTNGTQKEMNREPEEVRHLREFSNFLSPRIGFFQSEMWSAVMAVLSAVLPAVIVASSVIALVFLGWLGVTSLILADALSMPIPIAFLSWLEAPAILFLLIIGSHVTFEYKWSRQGKAEPLSWDRGAIHILLIGLIALGMYFGWGWLKASTLLDALPNTPGHPRWQWGTSINPPQNAVFSFRPAFSPYLFAAPILWTGLAVLLLVPRLIVMRFLREKVGTVVNAIDRALSRLLGAALIFTALALLWLAGCWINYTDWGANASAGGALVSGGAFALLRNWMGRLGPGKKGGVMDIVKPLIPQILAYLAICLWAVWIVSLLAGWIQGKGISPWWLAGYAFAVVLFALVFFDAAQVSMHSFYRNRLSRAYLGASNIDARAGRFVSAETNRQTDVRRRDDIELRSLSPTAAELKADMEKPDEDRVYTDEGGSGEGNRKSPPTRVRPLHLICCAANDIGGDHLGNLSRGSRSAVLSKFGFVIGDYWKPWDEKNQEEKAENNSKKKDEKKESRRKTLGLGSAITASAAAFNSNMGSLSMTLGAGVTFLCTALNLRLGLWLRHPLTPGFGAPKLVPGSLFFKEMFGITNSGLRPRPEQPKTQAASPPNESTAPNQAKSDKRTPVAEYVHLSDGAHFENLGLYELVRRHCRYIIVSDCGADAQVTFDDFGNAVRRIREDFGVEIEIDLSPLMPNAARLSKQHVAVGSISYDPRGDRKDNAILLYFKPALTGDEPCDIAQYRTRNEAFPHESTGDQFYDEAQWESYRRLGEHATYSAFRFVERERQKDKLSADAVFSGARWEWYQSPSRRAEKILELTGRLAVLEQQLRQDAPSSFVREMYPELAFFDPKQTSPDEKSKVGAEKSGPGQASTEASPEETSKVGAEESDPGQAPTEASPEEISKTLHFLTQMTQLMEDVWFGTELEEHWNDPNNLGWMNTFQRWAYTPSFRLWWPILKPMYGRKFRRFMEERLSLADEDYPETRIEIEELPKTGPPEKGVAQVYWRRMYGTEKSEEERRKQGYVFNLMLTRQKEEIDSDFRVQAGLAFLDLAKPIARWNVEDLFVPPSLWGAGLGALFLRKLLEELKAKGFNRCEVMVEKPKKADDNKAAALQWTKRTDVASRQQLNDLLAFYQRASFRLEKNLLVWGSEKATEGKNAKA